MAEPTTRPWGRWAALLVVCELVASWLDLRLGPFARVHWEERFNARAGLQFACGHLEAAMDLQYRTFCGGCTAEGLMAAPLYRTFGATHLVWKLVPEFFHAAVLILGTLVAARAAGGRAALAFAALMFGAPGFYRELAHTGWGNHVEATAFPLAALVLLLAGSSRTALWQRLCLLFAAGLILGLGFWFAHTSAHLVPAVALAALLLFRWQLPAFLLGIPLGAWPWWVYHRSRDNALSFAESWMSAIDLSPPAAWVDWLWGAYLRDGLWDAVDYGDPGMAPHLWWFLLWAVAVVGIATSVLMWRRSDPASRSALLFGPLGLACLLAIYAVRYDLWSNLPDLYSNAAFNLRYRTPLWPMLALCAAPLATVVIAGRTWPLRLPLLALVLFGTAQRVALWQEWRGSTADLRILVHDGWPDATVPTTQPHLNVRDKMLRPGDIDAALTFLADHQDPLDECHWSHVFEAGRRTGLGLDADPSRPDLPDALRRGVAAAAPDPTTARFYAFGIAKALDPKGELRRPDLSQHLDRLQALGLDLPVARELGKLGWEQAWIKDEATVPAWLDPRLWEGVCEGRGGRFVDLWTGRGTRAPRSPLPQDWQPGDCLQRASYWHGVGAAWAQHVGCRERDTVLLRELVAGWEQAAWQGYEAGCREHRGVPAP